MGVGRTVEVTGRPACRPSPLRADALNRSVVAGQTPGAAGDERSPLVRPARARPGARQPIEETRLAR